MLVPPKWADVARSILAELPSVDGEPADPVIEIAAALAREAGNRDLAAIYYLRAGRRAISRGTISSAAVLVEQAVTPAEDADAVATRIAAVDAHALTGHAGRTLREGEAVLRQLAGDPVAVAQVHLSMAAPPASMTWRRRWPGSPGPPGWPSGTA